MAIGGKKWRHYAETDGAKSPLGKQSERNAVDEFVKDYSNKASDEKQGSVP